MNNEEKEEFIDVSENFEKQKTKKEKKKQDKLEDLLLKANEEIADWKNEYAKVLADTKNLRKDLEKDQKDFIKYRAVGFIENLLPILDNFEFAFKNPPPNEETRNYLMGFQMIFNGLKIVLEGEGVIEIKPNIGDKFDPGVMQALETKENKDYEEGAVLELFLPGYKIHERLIRPAQVIVNKVNIE